MSRFRAPFVPKPERLAMVRNALRALRLTAADPVELLRTMELNRYNEDGQAEDILHMLAICSGGRVEGRGEKTYLLPPGSSVPVLAYNQDRMDWGWP